MSTAAAQHAPPTDWPRMMFRRVDPSSNMSRFWSARLQPSLFEEVLLVRNWGRIGSRGQERSYWFSSRIAALAAFEIITNAKRRRGYAAKLERGVLATSGLHGEQKRSQPHLQEHGGAESGHVNRTATSHIRDD